MFEHCVFQMQQLIKQIWIRMVEMWAHLEATYFECFKIMFCWCSNWGNKCQQYSSRMKNHSMILIHANVKASEGRDDTLLCSSSILQELCRMFATCCVFFVVWCQPISTILFRVVSLTLGQSYDCPSDSEATLKDMGKYIIWIHKNWWYYHNNTKHNKNKYIFLSNIYQHHLPHQP